MKQWIFLVMTLAAFDASAQPGPSSQGYFLPVGRSNDPFVFCTEGVPEHGWIAVNPVTGTWTPISQYVNYQWIPTYIAICPRAFGQGQWTGPGSGSMDPFFH